jgi:hypothetical protein
VRCFGLRAAVLAATVCALVMLVGFAAGGAAGLAGSGARLVTGPADVTQGHHRGLQPVALGFQLRR